MDEDLAAIMQRGIDSLVKLELLLFFDSNPDLVDTAQAIAARLARDMRDVKFALRALAASDLVNRFELGAGRYVLYSRVESHHTRASIRRLSEVYHGDEQGRIEIIKKLMGLPT
jgi:hypothetical protein